MVANVTCSRVTDVHGWSLVFPFGQFTFVLAAQRHSQLISFLNHSSKSRLLASVFTWKMQDSQMLAPAGSNETQDSQPIFEAYRAEFGVGTVRSQCS